jgi:hypothetical protein
MATERPTDHLGADLVACAAQIGHHEAALGVGLEGQLALRRDQLGDVDRRHRPALAGHDLLRAGAQRIGLGHGTFERRVEGNDVTAVVFAQPATAAGVKEGMPFVPGAVLVAILQAAHEREASALVIAAGAQLQR